MQRYIYETRFYTVGNLILKADGYQGEFEISGFKFRKAQKQPTRGIHYYVSYTVKASSYAAAIRKIDKKFLALEDAMSFYYCMPFIWEYWYYSIVKPDEKKNRIALSIFAPKKGVVMTSHIEPTQEIDMLIQEIEANPKFADALYYHGSLTRIDNLEFLRSHLPVMFQFVESVADKKEIKNDDGTKRSVMDHSDAKRVLGRDLYKLLYTPVSKYENSVRNTIAHGGSTNSGAIRPVTQGHVEDVIKKVRERIIERFNLEGIEAGSSRTDIVRYFYSREGNRFSIERRNHWGLERYVTDFERRRDPRIFRRVVPFPKSW